MIKYPPFISLLLLLIIFTSHRSQAEEVASQDLLKPFEGETAVGIYDATSASSHKAYKVHLFYSEKLQRYRVETEEDGKLLQNLANRFSKAEIHPATLNISIGKARYDKNEAVFFNGKNGAQLSLKSNNYEWGLVFDAVQEVVIREYLYPESLAIWMEGPVGLCRKTCSATIIYAFMDPALGVGQYLVSGEGKARDLDLQQLVYAYWAEEIHSTTTEGQVKIAMSLIDELEPFYKVISSTNDIEGYKDSPLDSDVECTIRKPWSYKNQSGNTCHIWYTYSSHTGRVCRFKIMFDEHGKLSDGSEQTILGHSIGHYDIFM